MIKNAFLAAAAVATLAAGTLAGPSNADAGISLTISGPGYGLRYGHRSPGYGSRYGYGHRSRDYWGGSRWYRSDHRTRSYRPHCRWKVKKVRVRTWDTYNNSWVTRKVRRRYRRCY